MKISKDKVIESAELIADVLNSGKVCEIKIEKGELAIIEIKRKLKKA